VTPRSCTRPDGHGFDSPAPDDPLGRPVDQGLLDRFVGAAFDGCTPCQESLLDRMVTDAVTTARLVELACVAVHQALGGLPASLTDELIAGEASPQFRRLARAGLDSRNDAMFRTCQRMTGAQRRAAANSAADLLIGILAGGPFGKEAHR
jgi:hypothetical protein